MTVLTDKIAVVTGAGSGIGEAIATLRHEEGAKVVLAGRNKDKLQNVANQLAQDSVKVVPTDFTSRNQYQPRGLLLANHVIEQDRRQYDQRFKIDNGDFLQ
uniref:SDR family NAD(P)-dependent oxidoreductase n=1 Tax=Staphylococcus aureus TaxID=1280 RepID=UPI00210EF944